MDTEEKTVEIKPNGDKMERISNFQEPMNREDLHCFLIGVCFLAFLIRASVVVINSK